MLPSSLPSGVLIPLQWHCILLPVDKEKGTLGSCDASGHTCSITLLVGIHPNGSFSNSDS